METLLDYETATLVKSYLPRNAVLYSLSEFFGACADATRTKIICALSISEMCVSEKVGSWNKATASAKALAP